MTGIYKIYWENCNYFYIGQSINIEKRVLKHIYELNKNKHRNCKLQNVYNKYGIPLFLILESCNKDIIDIVEQKYIDFHFKNDYCCNLSPTASSTKGYKHTEEAKIKISKVSKSRIITEETRVKLRNRPVNKNFGFKHKEETKKLFSILRKGKSKSIEWKIKISESNKKAYRKSSKKVINIKTNEIFSSIKEASVFYSINRHTLRYKLRKGNFFLKYL